jgi:hypothetical protein
MKAENMSTRTSTSSMSRPTIGSIVAEEVGIPVYFRGVGDKELPKSDGLLNGEVVDQPTNSVIPDPKTNPAILERDCYE